MICPIDTEFRHYPSDPDEDETALKRYIVSI